MKSIDELKKQHAREIAAAEARLARAAAFVAAGFDAPEYMADSRTHGDIHAAYRNDIKSPRSMGAAVAMFGRFAQAGAVSPFAVLRDGSFTTLHPEQHMPPKKHGRPYVRDNGRHASDYAAKLSVTHNAESRHTSAKLEFFALVAGELFSVSIEFGTDYIGQCHRLAPRAEIRRDARTDRIIESKYSPNTAAYAMADGFLSYSYGGDMPGRATGADHRFLFVSDTEGDGAACSHALAQLENLAAEIDGGAK